jgi:hypothetical protein
MANAEFVEQGDEIGGDLFFPWAGSWHAQASPPQPHGPEAKHELFLKHNGDLPYPRTLRYVRCHALFTITLSSSHFEKEKKHLHIHITTWRTGSARGMIKWGVSWEREWLDWKLLFGQNTCMATMRRRVIAAGLVLTHRWPEAPRQQRLSYEISMLPSITLLVDCFPVVARGPAAMFNGKYKQKCRKYQLVTDVVGNKVFATLRLTGQSSRHLELAPPSFAR